MTDGKVDILFMDDDLGRCETFLKKVPGIRRLNVTFTHTAKETVELLETGKNFDIICLDHDLGGETYCDSGREDCGMEVVRWMLAQKGRGFDAVLIHTWNSYAGKAMELDLRSSGLVEDLGYESFGSQRFWDWIRGTLHAIIHDYDNFDKPSK